MILEHVFTSLPKGLKPGSRGFSTAAATRGLTPPFVQLCESLSGYTHVFTLQSPDYAKNPIAFSHFLATVGSRTWHVLSRVAALPADYSGRTNKLAHHLLVPPSDTTPAGPAAELSVPDRFLTRWEGEARDLPENRAALSDPVAPCCAASAWRQAAGDAGWAGVLARHWMRNPEGTAYLVFTPGTGLLPLFDEALRLIPPERRWDVTFSTYVTAPPAGVTCHWRGCLPDNPLLRAAAKQTGTLLIDLANPGPLPAELEDDPLVRSACTGEPPEWTEADRRPPVPSRRAGADKASVIDINIAPVAQAPGPRRLTSVPAAPRRKKPLPLWLPPLAACVAIGLMAAYLIFDNKTKPQRPSPQSEAAYCAVTNFFADYEKAAKEIAEQQKALILETNELSSIIAETTYTEQLQKSMADVNGRWSTLTNFPIPNLERPDCQLLSHRPDYEALSDKVNENWDNWTNKTNNFCCLIEKGCEKLKKAEKTIKILQEKEAAQRTPSLDPSENLKKVSNKATDSVNELIKKILSADFGSADQTKREGLISKYCLTNCLVVAARYNKANQLIQAFPSNDAYRVAADLKEALDTHKEIMTEILDAHSDRVTVHASATILQGYTFPTNESPEKIYLYDSQRKSISITNTPKPFVIEEVLLVADNILAIIQTLRAVDTQKIWHLFNLDKTQPPHIMASPSTGWTLCNLANGDYGLICSPSSPLYQLVTGITQTVDDITLPVDNKTVTSNAVFSVRKKDAVPDDAFKDINKLRGWFNEIADEKVREGFQKALNEFTEKENDKKAGKSNPDDLKQLKKKWRSLEKDMPAAEWLRMMLRMPLPPLEQPTLSPLASKATLPPLETKSISVSDLQWNGLPGTVGQIKAKLPKSNRDVFTNVVAKIERFRSTRKPKEDAEQRNEIKEQWQEAEKEWHKLQQKDELERKQKDHEKQVLKEMEKKLKTGLSFNLSPVLKQLGRNID